MKRFLLIVGLMIAGVLLVSAGFQSKLETNVPGDKTIDLDKFEDWEHGRFSYAPAGDSTYRQRYLISGDSGWQFINIDEKKDTLLLCLRRYLAASEALGIKALYSGCTGAKMSASTNRVFGALKTCMFEPGENAASAFDANRLEQQTTSSIIGNYTGSSLFRTSDCTWHTDQWDYRTTDGIAPQDTIRIRRDIVNRRGESYFLVRMDIEWLNVVADSVRVIFNFEPNISPGIGSGPCIFDAGWVPHYGHVRRRNVFRADDIAYCVTMSNIGNPRAGIDTLADGTSAFAAHDTLLLQDYGPLTDSTFAGGFIIFKPDEEIVPFEFMFTDTINTAIPSLHADSNHMHVDSTNVLDSTGPQHEREIYGKTEMITFTHGEHKQYECAIGRIYFPGSPEITNATPVLPDRIVWTDGSVSMLPYSRKRK